MTLSAEERESIAESLVAALDKQLPNETHRSHHDWVALKIAEAAEKEKLIRDIKAKLITMGVFSGVVGMLAMMWYALVHGYGTGTVK